MRLLALPVWAYLPLLCSSTALSWTGSIGVNTTTVPYSSCNETTVGPTGPTGTGTVTTSSPPYSSCNSTTVGPTGPPSTTSTGTVTTSSPPYSSCNSTTVGSTGPTGTTGLNTTKTRTPCLVTTTFIVFTSSFVTTDSVVTTQTVLGDGPIIYGDSLTPTDGTATATVPTEVTSTIPETTTYTISTIDATTIGTPSTITNPPPSDFVPVQTSLPSATYNFQQTCNVSTTVSTSTLYQIVDNISQTTLSGTIIIFQSESEVYSASAFTNYSISYVTTTYSTSVYETTVSTFVPAGITNTFTATTTTVNQACATNNFADAIVVDHAPQYITYFDQNRDQTFSREIDITDAYSCCNYAFTQNADVWFYEFGQGLGCGILTTTDGSCTPAATNDSAEINLNFASSLHFVVGNGACGRFTAVVEDEF